MQVNSDDDRTEEAIQVLLETLDVDEERETYFEQMLNSVAGMAEANVGELDLKITCNAFKELQYSFKTFRKYDDRPKISVFGSARTQSEHPNYRAAEEFSALAADRDYMIVSGAGPGIMEAANKGAGRENSFGLHISLPHEYKPNRYISGDEKCIHFRYFFTRKLMFAKESEATIYFPGGFGTHDELFELLCLLQTGGHHLSPLILCDRNGYWEPFLDHLRTSLLEEGTISETDLQLLDYVTSPEEAIEIVDQFFSNYHSSRFLEEEFVIRFRDYPGAGALEELEDEFSHLCPESGFRVEEGILPGEENDAPGELYRLVFYYSNHDYGELRELIRVLNGWN